MRPQRTGPTTKGHERAKQHDTKEGSSSVTSPRDAEICDSPDRKLKIAVYSLVSYKKTQKEFVKSGKQHTNKMSSAKR